MAAPQNHYEPLGNGVALVHRLAQSPLGELWLALDQRRGPPGEPLLLRHISLSGGATPDTLARVAAAARAAMSLRHELLLPVREVQLQPLAVAYKYVEAQPLSTLLSSARARELLFPVGVALRLTIDLLRALQAVHESWLGWPAEVPYGGLLPASVLVSRDGRMRLCDALVASSALLQRGFDLSAAELAYRAPEQVYASIAPEPSTDVFIAASLLWELLAGRRLLSGSKEVIERKLLEHDLAPAAAILRSDSPLSRGLIELLDSSLALGPNQRPPTPGSLATALERCGHAIASHAEVAAFVDELAGPQLDRVSASLRLALGDAVDADETQRTAVPLDLAHETPETAALPSSAAAHWAAEAREAPIAAPESRRRASGSLAPPALAGRAEPAPAGVAPQSLAAAVALALERLRASGEFPAFAPEPARTAPVAPSLASLATPPRARAAVPRDAGVASSAPSSLPPPLLVRSVPPLPLLGPDAAAEASSAEEEKTIVHRAVRDPRVMRPSTTPPAPVRLAPKRALLAGMASVVLLILLWVFDLARSHQEKSRPASPAESGLSRK